MPIEAAQPPSNPSQSPADEAVLDFADFAFQSPIGEGGMGTVFRGLQKSTRWPVAIKVLKSFGTSPLAAFHRFRRESSRSAIHQHPNIVSVHGMGQTPEGKFFLVMDLVDGPDLQALIGPGRFTTEEVVRISLALAECLHFAHQKGVIHRDLKPSNVLLAPDGTVMVTDFGLAYAMGGEHSGLTQLDRFAGTPQYMAPEQASDEWGPIGPWTDVYGLGGTMYALLAGRPPITADSSREVIERLVSKYHEPVPLRKLRPQVPAPLEQICLHCLGKGSASRYTSAGDLANDLRSLVVQPVA